MQSCKQQGAANKVNEQIDRYNQLYKEAVDSKERNDTIFMGFRFGMSEKEYNAHLKKLSKEGKAKKDILGYYEIPIKDSHGLSYKAEPHPEYYKGKLCRLSLKISSDLGERGNSYVLLFGTFRDTHPQYDMNIKEIIEGQPEYSAFYKNTVVRCFGSAYSYMVYEDAPFAIKFDEEEHKKDSIEVANMF